MKDIELSTSETRTIRRILSDAGQVVPVDLVGELRIADAHDYIKHLESRFITR